MRDEVLEHGKSALLGTVGLGALVNWRDQVKGLVTSLSLHLPSELTVADRRQKREIRQLEQELHKWQVLVDSITGEEPGHREVAPPWHPLSR